MTPRLDFEDSDRAIRERYLSIGFLALVLLMAASDIIVDFFEGEPLEHMLIEACCLLVAILGAVYLWNESRKLRSKNTQLNHEMLKAHQDAAFWKNESREVIQGLGTAIDRQFGRWELSDAEREVGLLLLKGLSMKEIAEIRGTSEKTIRHQAASLYKKSNLEGRAQLSAFFLEDLLLPQTHKELS